MSKETIDRHRAEFPALSRGVYLLSHSLGPAPKGATAWMSDYLRLWEEHAGEDAWSASWWDLSQRFGNGIARLIGAADGSVQAQPTASVAMSVVASCFDFSRGSRRKVVTSALDFPSMGYIWEAQQRLGANVCVVPSDDDIVVPTQRIVDAIDEQTALVAISHVSYRSSSRVDAAAIVERAHAVGARVLLDVYQSVGVAELSAAAWDVDFLIGGTIKWICGGPSSGYLYVHPDRVEMFEPRLTGWMAHENPFAFSHAPMRYDRSVRRYAQGTPNIPGLFSAMAGLELIAKVGVPTIAAESRRRTQRIVDYATQRGWSLHSPLDVDQRGGTVMIETEHPESMVATLSERKVFVDCRPGVGLRLSPHFFNTDEEIDEALEVLADVMSST